MCRSSDRVRAVAAAAAVALAALLAVHGATAAALHFGFGKPATPDEIAAWDIDVRPDGTGLPPGRGSVADGQAVYDAKCASCHGTFGESTDYLPLAGGVGSLGTDQPMRTTGSKLNFATTLFDYIRRAMPFNAPKSLTDDEVYALTAYVLNLNDILPADAVLDRERLVAVKMPNRDGFTMAHGFGRRDGRPDTRNVACMHDCVREVRLSSEIPDYARDSHGNLAEQVGLATGVRTAAPPAGRDAAALARDSACMSCHAIDRAVVGPAFAEVARRYASDPGAAERLAAKIRSGGGGVWGSIPMPAQAALAPQDALRLARWVLERR
jgi:cytochrome c551/c552